MAGAIIRMAAAGMPSTMGCTAQGVKIMNLEEGVKAISFAVLTTRRKRRPAKGRLPANFAWNRLKAGLQKPSWHDPER